MEAKFKIGQKVRILPYSVIVIGNIINIVEENPYVYTIITDNGILMRDIVESCLESVEQEEKSKNICICSTMDLMIQGCKCGFLLK